MGCYQNAFATIRACYDEWKPAPTNPFQTWRDAFLPQRQVTLMEQDGPGAPPRWSPWNFPDLPKFPGEPGDGPVTAAALLAEAAPPDAPKRSDGFLIVRMVDWLAACIHVPEYIDNDFQTALAALRTAVTSPAVTTPTDALEKLNNVNRQLESALTTVAALLAEVPIDSRPDAPQVLNYVNLELTIALTTSARSLLVDLEATAVSVGQSLVSVGQRMLILANLGISIALGYVRDILFRGSDAYDALNTQDFRQWLQGCGASRTTLASAPIRALYGLAFAFPGGAAGSIENGSIAAGVTLRFAMELAFGYREAPLWRMAAGMGDTVFTPLYQVLLARNVSVQFFNRVTALRPSSDGKVSEIDLCQQVHTVDGSPYRPLVSVNHLDCWPNQPDWNQLENGQTLKQQCVDFESSFCTLSVGNRTLAQGADFDVVVLAIPPEALKCITAPLAAAEPAWQTALDASQSVATQALQLWMRRTVPSLGWTLGATVLSAFSEPYDSWADMSHLLSRETWNGPDAPQSIGYFCGCLKLPTMGPINHGTMHQTASALAESWLENDVRTLWPAANPPPWPMSGGEALSRYERANFDISDLYVQTPAGNNVARRFVSSETAAGFANLYVVGDWTRTRFSGGCFESAIESAMLAANAISGFPTEIQKP
jgi:uncharacterized protein with NAD-binding domain and iron-sulfur cluster